MRPALTRCLGALAALIAFAAPAFGACDGRVSICTEAGADRFQLIRDGSPATISVDEDDYPGVLRAARNLQTDLTQVAGAAPEARAAHGRVIIVGTLGRNEIIDRLVRERRLDVAGVAERWEGYVQQVVAQPMRGVPSALVIAGADKRGTIFGIYDLSRRIGVSPWSWWANVPVRRQANIYVAPGRRADAPVVRYRGIFLNDEDPALNGWARQTFGGFNHRFYERVFDLILRLKGNFLWPAMWGKSLWDDDPQTAGLADEMGVVLGTSHHEPMMRAHVEWARYGEGGAWDYTTNAEKLRAFWRAGIERRGARESLVTVGMRGDGDEPMTQGTAIRLLETIVADQRRIIADVTRRPAEETPQVWALYKEVQAYYDQGMRVPDDVTLLFSDDNWGNIRRLPDPAAPPRAGGYGVYYHFDYVGGPRNYKWLNTNEIERVWEQMGRAHAFGADRIWIVNVGDLKPMEFPISFFLDYAWSPDACRLECLSDYPRRWAEEQFGTAHAGEIGALLTRYAQLAAQRKPELIDPDTFSPLNFREAERIEGEWISLQTRAEALGRTLPPEDQDAYFQLVLHPILANGNLHALYLSVAENRLAAAQGRAWAANQYAEAAERRYADDQAITRRYHTIAGGAWNHMMDQTHIGYTNWQQPPENVMPEVRRIAPQSGTSIGVAVEGDARAWPGAPGTPTLPTLSRYGPQRWLIVFNRGATNAPFQIASTRPWLRITPAVMRPEEARYDLSVDWAAAPIGTHRVPITVTGAGQTITIHAPVVNPGPVHAPGAFIEADGIVAIEAAHARAIDANGIAWHEIPNLGRTLSAMTTLQATVPSQTPGGRSPRLEFDIHVFAPGERRIHVVTSPAINVRGQGGLRYAVSIDDAPPQIVAVDSDSSPGQWGEVVADNAHTTTSAHRVAAPGRHVVKLWLVDPGLVFQRVIVAAGALPATYLGPPESVRGD